MASERRLRILGRLARGRRSSAGDEAPVEACAEVTGMSGAGIMLMSGDVPEARCAPPTRERAHRKTASTSSAKVPAWTPIARTGRCSNPIWPNPSGPAGSPSPGRPSGGARAVFGFPFRSARCASARSTCTATAGAAHRRATRRRARHGRGRRPGQSSLSRPTLPPGKLAAELEAGADFQYVVHQASGMVAAQLGISVGQASSGCGPTPSATTVPGGGGRGVVARRLRFDPSGDQDAAS